jgi:hypothetical protein
MKNEEMKSEIIRIAKIAGVWRAEQQSALLGKILEECGVEASIIPDVLEHCSRKSLGVLNASQCRQWLEDDGVIPKSQKSSKAGAAAILAKYGIAQS